MNQVTFGCLWEFAEEIRKGSLTIAEGNEKCKELAKQAKADAIKAGHKAKRFTLQGQLRQYWGLGDPCGLSCTCYGVNVF